MVDDRIDRLDRSSLDCRAAGHAWPTLAEALSGQHIVLTSGIIVLEYVCGRCGTSRIVEINPYTGEQFVIRYQYSEGYLLAKEDAGSGRIDRSDIRKTIIEEIYDPQ